MKLNDIEDLRNAVADALRKTDCPCSTPQDRAEAILAFREIRKALADVTSLPSRSQSLDAGMARRSTWTPF